MKLTGIMLSVLACAALAQGQALFRYIDTPAPYAAQVTACANIGYTIASVHSSEENQAILQLIRNSARPMPTYLGCTAINSIWSWEDGTDWDYVNHRNDGIYGVAETRIAFNPSDARWHDWNSGSARLTAVCRRMPTPTVAPTTTPPTTPPTPAPTDWFEHHQNAGDNITALQEQVNGIAQDSANKSIAIARLQAQLGSPPGGGGGGGGGSTDTVGSLEARVAMLEQALVNQTEINRVLNGGVASIRATIISAVETFSTNQGTYDPSYTPRCTAGARGCVPSVESVGNNMQVNAPRGSVTIQSNQCGRVDPCRAEVGLNAVAAAMERLRNINDTLN